VPLFDETLKGQTYLVFYEGYAKWQNVTIEELGLKTLQDYDEVNRQIGRWCKKTRDKHNYAFGYWNGERAETEDGKTKIGVVGIDMDAAKLVHYTVEQMYNVDPERHPENIWLLSLEYMQKAKKLFHPDYVAVLPGSERGKRGKDKVQMHRGWLIKAKAAEVVEY
jgi:hypothetical protein